MADLPRSAARRKSDTLGHLSDDADCWVASADAAGNAYLVPLSFVWTAGVLVLATLADSTTARNLTRAGVARLALGGTRDVVMIDGTVAAYTHDEVPKPLGDAFAVRHWDARLEERPYAYFAVTPTRIQAWREENELRGRTIMRNGTWLT